ncbi:MAG: FHA domain-containing protein [Tannerellaceae bacterium]|jgi:pSer/pThr/pTyr-binding forkhead associated (FHA) protein|nr:FHA domain-containing protein [Tannerellaceae bacterium]
MYNKLLGELKVINKENREIACINLYAGENKIGRSSKDKTGELIVSDDAFLSREHFMIIVTEDEKKRIRFYLQDNNSRNGTFLKDNKKNIRKKLNIHDYLELSDNDVILGGETCFIIKKNSEDSEFTDIERNTKISG